MGDLKVGDKVQVVGDFYEVATITFDPVAVEPPDPAALENLRREVEAANHRMVMALVADTYPSRLPPMRFELPDLGPCDIHWRKWWQPCRVPLAAPVESARVVPAESAPPPPVDESGVWLVTTADLRATRHGKGLGSTEQAGWGLYEDE